jgi:hypothetical protein
LYNSGITIDLIVPTSIDLQTLVFNCFNQDRQLGMSGGAHYFAYNDLVLKTKFLDFLQPLIINSSYVDWRKNGKLLSIIKLPDLMNIMATLAALCNKKGFDNFVVKCTRVPTDDHPELCRHVETLTVDIFKMIITRYSTLNKDAIEFLAAARNGARHTAAEISHYQAKLGMEGERLTFGNFSFVMRIPSLAEHGEAGSKFMADIINEIDGDNTEGRVEQQGLRYIRTFLPWIASMEKKTASNGIAVTAEPRAIVRILERLDQEDPDKLRDAFRQFINKTQLTYVGYPVTPCPSCSHVAETPSGLRTIDPFSAFFTLALLYINQASSTTTEA